MTVLENELVFRKTKGNGRKSPTVAAVMMRVLPITVVFCSSSY